MSPRVAATGNQLWRSRRTGLGRCRRTGGGSAAETRMALPRSVPALSLPHSAERASTSTTSSRRRCGRRNQQPDEAGASHGVADDSRGHERREWGEISRPLLAAALLAAPAVIGDADKDEGTAASAPRRPRRA